MTTVFPRADYRTIEPTALTDTSKTLCYTVGDDGEDWADVTGILIVGAGACQVYCKLSSGGTEQLLNDDVTVEAGYPHPIDGLPIHMEAGGTINAEGESGQVIWIGLHRGQKNTESGV